MSKISRWLPGVLLLAVLRVSPGAQVTGSAVPQYEGLRSPDSLAADTLRGSLAKPSSRRVNPGTAVLLSALLPGGGQFYAGQPLKGVIIGAAELGLAGLSIHYYRRGNADIGNTFLWWTGFAIGFSMADAYVTASMYGFREEQRLGMRSVRSGIAVAYRF